MANEVEVTGTSASSKGGMGKSIAILAAVALVCRVVTTIATGNHAQDYPGAKGRFIGENIGGALGALLFGLIFFFIVRLVRRRSGDPFAGVFSGLFAMLVASYLVYVGELSHISH